MRFSTLTTSALASASLASARLVGISAPTTLAPNTTFDLTLLSEGYIQSVADIAVAWGFQLAPGYTGALGSFPGSAYLGPEKSNIAQDNLTISATVPAGLDSESWKGKDVVLTAGIYSLYGASGGPVVAGFNVTVRIGDVTSNETVSSDGWAFNNNGV